MKNELSENNPKQLNEFLTKLNELVDEYHHNIYLLDGVFEGIELIDKTVKKQLIKE
jgi:hypothetical protein